MLELHVKSISVKKVHMNKLLNSIQLPFPISKYYPIPNRYADFLLFMHKKKMSPALNGVFTDFL